VAQFEQHVVRDVDDVVDGAHAGSSEPLLHPGRRGRNLHLSERAAIPGAAVGILDCHPQFADLPRVACAERGETRHLHEHVVQGRDLAGDAEHAEAVGTVGRDLQIDHGIVALRRRARERLDRRHLEARHVQVRRQLRGRHRNVHQLTEPRDENLQKANCSRKRRSFS
jgi:hypothetical protein